MPGGKFKNRHRLSKKEIRALEREFVGIIGISPFSEDSSIDIAETEKHTVILEGDDVIGIYIDDRPFPTVRGILKRTPSSKYVTVDMGAVKFVAGGADVMAPGIVEADESIKEGDVVFIRDIKNNRPIAVGIALVSGNSMIREKKGKAVKNINHVGDDIWNLGNP